MENLENISQIANIDLTQIGAVILAIIAVTKGFNEKFKINNSLHRELVTLLFSLAGFAWLLFNDNELVSIASLFVVIYFGATGIYNFIPKGEGNITVTAIPDDYVTEASEVLEDPLKKESE